MTIRTVPPSEIPQTIREMQWSVVTVGGSMLALICPACQALVTGQGKPANGVEPRELHIRFHESLVRP